MDLKPTLVDNEPPVVGSGDSKEADHFESATLFDLMDGQVKLGCYHVQTLRALIKQVCDSQCNRQHKVLKWECSVLRATRAAVQ